MRTTLVIDIIALIVAKESMWDTALILCTILMVNEGQNCNENHVYLCKDGKYTNGISNKVLCVSTWIDTYPNISTNPKGNENVENLLNRAT